MHILRLYWCIGGTKTVTTVDLFIWFKSIRLIYERNECVNFKYDIRSGVGISEVQFLYSSLECVNCTFIGKENCMVGIKIFDENKIDTSSTEIREKVAKAISDYVFDNWYDVVCIENSDDTECHEALFKVTL